MGVIELPEAMPPHPALAGVGRCDTPVVTIWLGGVKWGEGGGRSQLVVLVLWST